MVRLAIVAAALASACYEDRYTCGDDADCDLGEGGRCETDGFCTSHDPACATRRSYEQHAGELTNTCYDDREVPLNACAGGQPPAAPTGCFANVCARLASCCELAWTDACVQVAQEECDLSCDTRLAITATRGSTTELWDVRWTGQQWTIQPETALAPPYGWVAPAPGSIEPRITGITPLGVVVGAETLKIGAGRTAQAITSINFDRDHRDTIAIGYATSGGAAIEIWKLDDRTSREIALIGNVEATALTWGDENRDGFPDGVARTTGATYSFLENLEGDGFVRKVANQVTSSTTGGGTPGAPQIRSFEWLDFDGDGRLDLAVFGASVRLHTAADGLRDAAERDLDCIPPSTQKTCSDEPEPNLETASFAGGALPTADGPSVVVSAFPARKLYRVQPGNPPVVRPLPFPGDSCACQAACTMCPGVNCSCTYDCTSCVTVLAVIARDLDGDHRLDLIAIDAKLRIYTATAASGFAWSMPTAIPTTFTSNTFLTATTSVSGAPL